MAMAASSSCSSTSSPPLSPPRKKRLSLSRNKKSRFAVSTDEELDQARKRFVPANTVRCTDWAMKVFNSWIEERNKLGAEKCPSDVLENPDVAVLDKWLSAFVVEVRCEDGQQYPPNTINQLLAGLWRQVRSKTPNAPNFMNRKDHRFGQLNGAISSVFRKLREQGVGASIKHAPVITPEEEDLLWSTGIMGDHNPLALQLRLSNSVTIFIDSCIFLLQNNYFLADHAHYLILYAWLTHT